ncbi:unnamed protein product [Echinostoma caproni]|uniref:HAD family hydrolase n=1 Tax=Echinostoma caproni TaxID=27848 RepID=A0A3P8KKB0_9TREM|nr:unnamed protein product [Echinostoma caproni]
MDKMTSPEIARQFLAILGYTPETRRAAGGLLVDSSKLHIKECLGYLLMLNGYGMKEASAILEKIWYEPPLEPTDVIPGVVDAIRELKSKHLHIAINTSDTRDACREFLDCSKLDDCVDLISCAEDADRHPKPLPHTCTPQQTMVVGDSPADLLSGRAAGVRLTVGVLSGFSLAHNLLSYANVLVPNATYLPHLIQLDWGNGNVRAQ